MYQAHDSINVIFTAEEIARQVDKLALEISRSMGPEIFIVSILKGSFIFAADLMRALHVHGVRPQVDFITMSSYEERSHSTGNIHLLRDIKDDLSGKKILLLDDILDTGQTLHYVRKLFADRGAGDIKLCVLLDKPGRRQVEITAEFVGFNSPEVFVVGYGLDFGHRFRELPFIGAVPTN